MEFRFNVNEVFVQPIAEIGTSLIPAGFKGDRRAMWDALSKVTDIINAMGSASAAAQGLTKPITTADRLRNSSEQKVYLMIDPSAYNGKGAVTGMLKTGTKGLYVFDRDGQNHHIKSPCILDFYVHESRQRSGLGKLLFEYMLQRETVRPEKMAVDRPSEKLLGFLNKHYGLGNPIRQMNNFVVYDGFFPSSKEETIINESNLSKRGANGLQNQATSPFGRYGAPRPLCSMGQIIHNQSAAVTPQEPSGQQEQYPVETQQIHQQAAIENNINQAGYDQTFLNQRMNYWPQNRNTQYNAELKPVMQTSYKNNQAMENANQLMQNNQYNYPNQYYSQNMSQGQYFSYPQQQYEQNNNTLQQNNFVPQSQLEQTNLPTQFIYPIQNNSHLMQHNQQSLVQSAAATTHPTIQAIPPQQTCSQPNQVIQPNVQRYGIINQSPLHQGYTPTINQTNQNFIPQHFNQPIPLQQAISHSQICEQQFTSPTYTETIPQNQNQTMYKCIPAQMTYNQKEIAQTQIDQNQKLPADLQYHEQPAYNQVSKHNHYAPNLENQTINNQQYAQGDIKLDQIASHQRMYQQHNDTALPQNNQTINTQNIQETHDNKLQYENQFDQNKCLSQRQSDINNSQIDQQNIMYNPQEPQYVHNNRQVTSYEQPPHFESIDNQYRNYQQEHFAARPLPPINETITQPGVTPSYHHMTNSVQNHFPHQALIQQNETEPESQKYLNKIPYREPLYPTIPASNIASRTTLSNPKSRTVQKSEIFNKTADALRCLSGKRTQQYINPLQRNITAAQKNLKVNPNFGINRPVIEHNLKYSTTKSDFPNSKGSPRAPSNVDQEFSPPKLDRPQTLPLHTSDEIAESEVPIEITEDIIDAVDEEIQKIAIHENEEINVVNDRDESIRKTPSHLTDQGYFDLKFYHNKLW